MAHPFQDKRDHKVQHDRVGDRLKGYANSGGLDVAQDKPLVRSMMKKKGGRVMRMAGGAVRSRADRPGRANGGRTKKGKSVTTNVHINVAQPSPSQPAAGATAGPGAIPVRPVPQPIPMPPPGMGPGGPGGPPPGMGGPPGLGGPPGMPPMRAKGGRIKPGPGWTTSEHLKTQVSHTDGKNDLKDMDRKRVVTFKAGGRVVKFKAGGKVKNPRAPFIPPGSSKDSVAPITRGKTLDEPLLPPKRATGGKIDAPRKAGVLTPHLPSGAGGGLARLKKAKIATKGYHGPIS